MQELVELSLNLHMKFVIAMILVALINLYFIFTDVNFSIKVKYINPIYYMFYAAIFFTGLIVLGVNHLALSIPVFFMIVAWIYIFVMSIKMFKVYKKGNSEKYRKVAKVKYIVDVVLIIIVAGLAHMKF